MKIKVAVVFGGKSVEHEISVVSALQAISAANSQKYEIVPVYITKEGEWFSGDVLLKVDNYKNTATLLKQAVRIFPLADGREPGLYTKGMFGALKLYSNVDVVLPVLHRNNFV